MFTKWHSQEDGDPGFEPGWTLCYAPPTPKGYQAHICGPPGPTSAEKSPVPVWLRLRDELALLQGPRAGSELLHHHLGWGVVGENLSQDHLVKGDPGVSARSVPSPSPRTTSPPVRSSKSPLLSSLSLRTPPPVSPIRRQGERLTGPESDGCRDGWKDGQTDAWRARWPGRVVNGVRREAPTDRCGGDGVGGSR